MDNHFIVLQALQQSIGPEMLARNELVCKAMPHDDSAVFYLAKNEWTNRLVKKAGEDTQGVFCSLWTNAELIKQGRFSYNIHSLKLHALPACRLTSRKFAEDFRNAVKDRIREWPNVRTDYGPLTLLQGYELCELDDFSTKARERVEAFASISGIIDALFEQGKL